MFLPVSIADKNDRGGAFPSIRGAEIATEDRLNTEQKNSG
jgi:hypothetical protein